MSTSSDEEHDDNNIFDQLKSIKPFTVDQLYLLHPDVGCPKTGTSNPNETEHNNIHDNFHDQDLYQNLIDFEQLKHKLYKFRTQVKSLNRKTFDHVDKVWYFKEQAPRKIGMCQQGKVAETTFKYKQAFINTKQLTNIDLSFNELIELISKEYIYYSFESQMRRHRISTQLTNSYHISDYDLRKNKLKSAITTLIDFIKHLGDSKSDFVIQCRNWLVGLIKRFLETEDIDDYKFIIAQLCKGPSGTADWSSKLVEYKPLELMSDFDLNPKYITHCSALLSELFINLKNRIRRVTLSINNTENIDETSSTTEQNWSLIDPRFSCSEELSSNSSNTLSENDVIKFCLGIPVAQIFKNYVKKCLEFSEYRSEIDKNYEYIMLKLLTIGTVIIRTYQIGLETFNSIQYGNLIEYLSTQIRRTVIVLSEQWTEFKRRLKGIDNALMMRLQVEYDNFILRSILIILELRQSGIWRHLSRIEPEELLNIDHTNSWSADSIRPALTRLLQVTGLTTTTPTLSSSPNIEQQSSTQPIEVVAEKKPTNFCKSANSLTYEFSVEWFKEVSEPMLWHILWQFYHNAFVSSCDYHSDDYWLEKFQEKSVVYLFVNKIRDSPPGECSYLLNSVTSMLLSRNRGDSKFVNFVATELFDLSFRQKELKDKITKKGLRSLIRCAEKFPNLISLYMNFMEDEELLDDDIVVLFKGCSITGWLCDDYEFSLIASWLIDSPLTSSHNKIAKILISKLLLNSPEFRNQSKKEQDNIVINSSSVNDSIISMKKLPRKSIKIEHQFVDLKLRRKLALLLYEASISHSPESNEYGPQSFGAFVELAFEGIFCEKNSTCHVNLLELAINTNYQQFYIWTWRLLFTFRLHILNQPETDWNDVQSRSGTSRSIKNTVLVSDSFHPVPTIQDSECLLLSEGVKKNDPIALFIYLLMTDVTWQVDTLDSCINHLNMMANSGHLTPSLMGMKFLTICHLDDLSEKMGKDAHCIEYFTTIMNSNFDITRVASLITAQMQNLKQYRQLQLSQFYITVLLEVAIVVLKQQASSWFSADDHKLDKIACLLDYIVKFNFPTQRLEIIRKFYDCSYSLQYGKATSGWLSSFFTTNSIQNVSSSKREFITTLHVLTQKFKKYSWLRWVTTECDTLRLEKIWEDIVQFLSTNENSDLDSAIKKVCPQINSGILKTIIPIYSWINQIFDMVESDLSHPLCPLIWYNFFLNYFSNTLNGGAIGLKLVNADTSNKLLSRLDALFNYNLYKQRNWSSNTNNVKQNSLAKLYRAFRLWLQDISLQDVYVDMDRLKEDYLVPLLKTVMESSTEGAYLTYIDIQSIETQNRNLSRIWSTATLLYGNNLIKDMMFVTTDQNDSIEILTSVDDEASDAISLIFRPSSGDLKSNIENKKALAKVEQEFKIVPKNQQFSGFKMLQDEDNQNNQSNEFSMKETIDLIKMNCNIVFEESSIFTSNIGELEKLKSEILDLIQQLYINKKVEHIRFVACAEGNECAGPARLKFEVEEATIDDRKSECIQDRQGQCDAIVEELLLIPTSNVVKSSIIIEDNLKQLIKVDNQAKFLIESILKWISEPSVYSQLNGNYYTANHILKTILDILSTTDDVDTYNSTLIDVCFDHPGSVQILSPYLSPSTCSTTCFLELYKRISYKHHELGPMALFVLLSKFDLNSWLKENKKKEMLFEIIRTTCNSFSLIGKQPDESYNLTFDLYKRHIQIELAPPDRRKPEFISLVLCQFLTIMDNQTLSPSLWLEFLSILGLEKQISLNNNRNINTDNRSISSRQQINRSLTIDNQNFETFSQEHEHDELTIAFVIEDVAKLADCQTVLDYHALNNMMILLGKFLRDKDASVEVTLLELYHDYLDKFSIVINCITFMWLRAIGEHYPDNHKLIWEQFMDIWFSWVFLNKNCQNVGKSSYSLMASQFVAAIRYMIYRIPDNIQQILRSILLYLANYVKTTRQVVYLELTILQRCLKILPWSSLLATAEDFENLAILSEQENYNVSDLISHILLQINTKDSLTHINRVDSSILPHVAERLATTIIYQSNYLKGFRLYGGFFITIPTNRITRIAESIMPRMEFTNLEHNQINKLLVNLLRFMCIKIDINDQQQLLDDGLIQFNMNDSFDRSLIYAKFVSNYLINLLKNHPTMIKHHKSYLFAVMDNSLTDLKILLSPDVDIIQKTTIYESLLECCSSNLIDENSRLFIARSLIRSSLLKNHPIVVMEVFQSIGQIISDAKVLVYTIEKMIILYLNMNGYYEKVWKSFKLKVLPSDLYLEACIEENSPLALLVYFEALSRNGCGSQQDNQSMTDSSQSNLDHHILMNNNKIWVSFFHWISQLSLVSYVNNSNELKSNDIRLAIAWLKLLDMLEPNLIQYIHCEHRNTIESLSDSTNDKKPSKTKTVPTESDVNTDVKSNQQQQQQNPSTSSSTTTQSHHRSSTNTTTRHNNQPVTMIPSHKALVNFVKQLISMYDSCNSSGLWSYLKFSRVEESSKMSIIALSVACFLSDRALICLNNMQNNRTNYTLNREDEQEQQRLGNLQQNHLIALRDEMIRLRKSCLSKLESARKTKHYLDNTQFIEGLIESVNQNDKVQYSDGVQLITTFVKNLHSEVNSDDCTCLTKILPTFTGNES